MSNLGLPELAIVLVIALVLCGPKRLPGLGRSLGGGLRDFKDSLTGKDDDSDATLGDALAPGGGADSTVGSSPAQ